MAEVVLIVDDDPVQRRLLEAMVQRFGYQAMTAEGGDAAIEVRFPDDFKETRTLVGIASSGVAESSDALDVGPTSIGPGSVSVSTDKPLYQPGQTVHVRALAMASHTVPTGFSGVPPSGPAMPLTATARSTPIRSRAPLAIARTTSSLTAP